VYAPDQPRVAADVVNLGYVVNVIDDAVERAAVLRAAWALTLRTLVVSARLRWEAAGVAGSQEGDGWVTTKGTFQRFYEQEELRAWIDAILDVRSVAAAPGIFYVFRDRAETERLLAKRARRDSPIGSLRIADLLFEQHRALLEPLRNFVAIHRHLPTPVDLGEYVELTEVFGSVRSAFLAIRRATGPDGWSDVDVGDTGRGSERRFLAHQAILQNLLEFLEARGRLPHPGELSNEAELKTSLGGIRHAFSLIRRATGDQRWEEFTIRRRDDFLVYLALSVFGGRPRFSDLPDDLQYDARDFFGSYQAACKQADVLLYAAGDHAARDTACYQASLGKLTPEALYVHARELGKLPTVLRVYEGCGRALSGTVEEANIVKLHRLKPQVSYLSYPKFDPDPHPVLATVVISRLALLDVTHRDFRTSQNPPVLHRKEAFVSDDYPDREKFARLTEQEERHGLLDDPAGIGTMNGWNERLQTANWVFRGHRLVRAPAAHSQ
jgi:hypothetical protein